MGFEWKVIQIVAQEKKWGENTPESGTKKRGRNEICGEEAERSMINSYKRRKTDGTIGGPPNDQTKKEPKLRIDRETKGKRLSAFLGRQILNTLNEHGWR